VKRRGFFGALFAGFLARWLPEHKALAMWRNYCVSAMVEQSGLEPKTPFVTDGKRKR
jgi:hypothetical protein